MRTIEIILLIAALLTLITLAASIVLRRVFPVFRFPSPKGPNGIGTVTYHWVDACRQEVFIADSNARRELVVQIWYPAKKDATSQHAPYIPDADIIVPTLARVHHIPNFYLKNLRFVTTNAIESAAASDDEPGYHQFPGKLASADRSASSVSMISSIHTR